HLAQRLLFLPRGLDGSRADLADAFDLAQFARLLAEHAERVGAECIDDLVRVNLADARHETAAEVFADAVDRRRQLTFIVGDLDLRAVLRVLRPLAGKPERLAALHAR